MLTIHKIYNLGQNIPSDNADTSNEKETPALSLWDYLYGP